MSGYFEGWYFKQQSEDGMIAFIPAIHTDVSSKKTGSLQIVTRSDAYYIELSSDSVRPDRRSLAMEAGGCVFSSKGLTLKIHQKDIDVTGSLRFGPMTPPHGDIMGPYRLLPFMECRHSVFSLAHEVEGSLTVNGRRMDFANGIGYIEGDRGRSFPKRYIWTQCSWDKGPAVGIQSGLRALMLSVAEVRPLGIPFIGIIGFVYFDGTEHRIATYRGAKIAELGGRRVCVRQGELTLTAQLLDGDSDPSFEARKLRAPISGGMVRLIRESLTCRARYTFSVKDRVLFDSITERASFEYEF